FQTTDVPAPLQDEAQAAREKLMEMVAEVDDALMEKFFSAGELSQEELQAGLVEAGGARPPFPGFGTAGLPHTPRPPPLAPPRAAPRHPRCPPRGAPPPSKGKKPKDPAPPERAGRWAEPYSAYIFKTIADPYSGKISLFRVYSGVLKSDATVNNASRDLQER